MAAKTQIVLVLLLLIFAFALGALLFRGRGDPELVARLSAAENALRAAEARFEEAIQAERKLQEEKDQRIADLKVRITKREEDIKKQGTLIEAIRTQLLETGEYNGLVATLDKQWQERYQLLEETVKDKDSIIAEWEEKFEARTKLIAEEYAKKEIAKDKLLGELRGQVSTLTTAYGNAKTWALIGKVLTGYFSIRTGVDLWRK